MRTAGAAIIALLTLVLAGCGRKSQSNAASPAAPPACPQAWRAGSQKLADEVNADVLLPLVDACEHLPARAPQPPSHGEGARARRAPVSLLKAA
jgi:hypothetical protein